MRSSTEMTIEALKIQLDTLQLKVQVLQVENARLRSEKPETTEEIDAEREGQSVLQKEVNELRQSLHQSREAELQLTQEKETLEQELSDTNEAREQEKEELERNEAATKQKITELCTVNGRLQLELKCVQQEVELYEYRLLAERSKVDSLQVQLHAVCTNKVSLCNAVDGTVSTNTLPHSSEGAAEVLPN